MFDMCKIQCDICNKVVGYSAVRLVGMVWCSEKCLTAERGEGGYYMNVASSKPERTTEAGS